MPVLALGGEASFGTATQQAFAPVSEKLETDVVPKAGHWIGEFERLAGLNCLWL
jgi:hypothetical protein